MDPSPLHGPKTGVDFWKPLSDGLTMAAGGSGGLSGVKEGEEKEREGGGVLVAHENAN